MQFSLRCPSLASEDPGVDTPIRYGDRYVEGASCLRVVAIGEPLVRASWFSKLGHTSNQSPPLVNARMG